MKSHTNILDADNKLAEVLISYIYIICGDLLYLTPMRRPVGRPALTWLKQIETDMNATNVQLNLSKDSPEQIIITFKKITKDRSNWRRIIRDAMEWMEPIRKCYNSRDPE